MPSLPGGDKRHDWNTTTSGATPCQSCVTIAPCSAFYAVNSGDPEGKAAPRTGGMPGAAAPRARDGPQARRSASPRGERASMCRPSCFEPNGGRPSPPSPLASVSASP